MEERIIKNLKLIPIGIVALTCLSTTTGCKTKEQESNNTITITDMVGDTITIEKNPTKVACVSRTTYDLMVAFGLDEYVDGAYSALFKNSWATTIYPNMNNKYQYVYNPSYETFLSRGVDLVFAPEKYIAEGLREHGINAITISLYGTPTFDNYLTYFSTLVSSIWDDENVKAKVEAWNNKVNKAVNDIQTELAKHEIEKQKIYYVRGDSDRGIGYTDTKGSFVEYAYRVLGFECMSSTLDYNGNKPSAEAICAYNPDKIVFGGVYANKHLEEIKVTEPYTTLNCVKNNELYIIPVAFTQLEQINVLTPEFFYDQANRLYPDIFNYDIKSMMKNSIKEYFNTELTDIQLDNILNGLNPTGGNLY